ncbi:hypothetical protein HWV62_31449 [Athelia sp. TMB]|nr:hypothetical protein HWV62_31449 [Athelia sp. TMB]
MTMPVYTSPQYSLSPQPSQYHSSPSYYSTPSYPPSHSSSPRQLVPPYAGGAKDLMLNQNASYASYPAATGRSHSAHLPPQHLYNPVPVQQSRQSHSHPRSHAMQTYLPPVVSHQSAAISSSPPAAQYASEGQYGHSTTGTQYPASPSRPFSCDMCALSFNRQHDLKRHRETHSGEKPFLCNGGCGKTFTRKDALKRHQVSQNTSVRRMN